MKKLFLGFIYNDSYPDEYRELLELVVRFHPSVTIINEDYSLFIPETEINDEYYLEGLLIECDKELEKILNKFLIYEHDILEIKEET